MMSQDTDFNQANAGSLTSSPQNQLFISGAQPFEQEDFEISPYSDQSQQWNTQPPTSMAAREVPTVPLPVSLPLMQPMPLAQLGFDPSLVTSTSAHFSQQSLDEQFPAQQIFPENLTRPPSRWDYPLNDTVSGWGNGDIWRNGVDQFDMTSCLSTIDPTSPTLSNMSFGTNPSVVFSPLFSDSHSDFTGSHSVLPTPSTTPVSILSLGSGQMFPTPSGTPSQADVMSLSMTRTTTPTGMMLPVSMTPAINMSAYRQAQSPYPPPPLAPPSRAPSRVQTTPIAPPPPPQRVTTPQTANGPTVPPRTCTPIRTPATEPIRKTPVSSRTGTNQCDVCNKRFQRTSELSKHRRYHLKDQRCEYEGCTAAFSTRKDLKRHINSAHATSKTGHVCRMSGCGKNATRKVYNRSDNFLRHLRTAHLHDNIDVNVALNDWLDDSSGSEGKAAKE